MGVPMVCSSADNSPFRLLALSLALLLAVAGCGALRENPAARLVNFRDPAVPGSPLAAAAPNPLTVPVTDPEFVWNQLVDTVDDYFDIKMERRVQQIGAVITEGRIETHPQPGATIQERWRQDSVPGYQTWHATAQSIRRIATVRVMPAGGQYAVQVVVDKELEDVERPVHATPGSMLPRHDGSLVRDEDVDLTGPKTLGWIPLGRDFELENEILTKLYGRLVNTGPPPPMEFLPQQ